MLCFCLIFTFLPSLFKCFLAMCFMEIVFLRKIERCLKAAGIPFGFQPVVSANQDMSFFSHPIPLGRNQVENRQMVIQTVLCFSLVLSLVCKCNANYFILYIFCCGSKISALWQSFSSVIFTSNSDITI